jgi:hypothetical protein
MSAHDRTCILVRFVYEQIVTETAQQIIHCEAGDKHVHRNDCGPAFRSTMDVASLHLFGVVIRIRTAHRRSANILERVNAARQKDTTFPICSIFTPRSKYGIR